MADKTTPADFRPSAIIHSRSLLADFFAHDNLAHLAPTPLPSKAKSLQRWHGLTQNLHVANVTGRHVLCQGFDVRSCTDKKGKKIFLIYKEIQMGAVAKSYMRKGFLIYEEMRKYLVIQYMRRPLFI
jgi:hypothetical protein